MMIKAHGLVDMISDYIPGNMTNVLRLEAAYFPMYELDWWQSPCGQSHWVSLDVLDCRKFLEGAIWKDTTHGLG